MSISQALLAGPPKRAAASAALFSCLLGAAYLSGHPAAHRLTFVLGVLGCAVATGIVFWVYAATVRAALAWHRRAVGARVARRRVIGYAATADVASDPLAEEEAALEEAFAALEAHERR